MKTIQYLVKNPLSLFGLMLLLFFAIIALIAPWIAVPEAYQISAYDIPRSGFWMAPRPPSAEHLFGTTQGQFDIFYGLVWGTRTAFRIGLGIVLVSSIFGIIRKNFALRNFCQCFERDGLHNLHALSHCFFRCNSSFWWCLFW